MRDELESEKQISQQLQGKIENLREKGTIHAHAVLRAAEQQRAEAMEQAQKAEEEVHVAERRALAALEEMQKLQSAIEEVRGELESERLVSQRRQLEVDTLREQACAAGGFLLTGLRPPMNTVNE